MNQIQIFATSPAFVPVSIGWTVPLSHELQRLGMIGAAWPAEALEDRIAELAADIEQQAEEHAKALESAFEEGARDRDDEISRLETDITKLQDALQALDEANGQANAELEAQRAEVARLTAYAHALYESEAKAHDSADSSEQTPDMEVIDYSAVPLPVDLDFTAPGSIPGPSEGDQEAVEAAACAEPIAPPAPAPAGEEAFPQPWFVENEKGYTLAAMRCRIVGTDSILVQHDDSCGYQLFLQPDSLYLVGFVGLCKKPFHAAKYRPDAQENWTARIASAIEKERARRGRAKARTAERAAQGHTLEVGDVLRAVWGYDQTNVDYYEVTKKIGRSMVEVREISGHSEDTGWMQGNCAPCPGAYVGKPKRCRPSGDAVRIRHRYASKIAPTAIIGGKPMYGVDHWTAYA